MELQTTNFTYNQFLVFLLLYAASSDYKFTKEEKEFIKLRTGVDDLSDMEEMINNFSDYDIIQTIMGYKDKYFKTDEEKERIFKEMKNLFLSDKKFSLNEENIFRALNQLIYSLK